MLIDILAAIVVLVSTFISFLRGLIREVLTIAGVVGGLAAAYYGGPILTPYMEGWIGMDPAAEDPQKLFDTVPYDLLAQGLSYALIFIVVVVVLSIFSHMIAEIVKTIGLGALDRTLGVVFGIARGVLLLGLLYLPIHLTFTTDDQQEKINEWFAGSQSHFYMEVTAEWIAGFLPDSTKEEIEQQVQDGVENAGRNEARDTLQRMDLLNRDEKAPESDAPDRGYTDQFRNEMDQLFQQEDAPDDSNRPPAQDGR